MDFRYLVETKNEFNNFLCGILVPHIFHGIKGMFKYSENVFEQIEQKNKRGARINNPGIIQIFKKTLDGIKELNNHEIEEEYQRIKFKSNCVDFFDSLVRATFKSFVLFLTWDPKIDESKYTNNVMYDQISIKDFIHKCYIISCEYFRESPELFLNSKSNKKDIFEIIKGCIELSIKKSLPYNQIIVEYLEIEFTKKESKYSKELADVKNMVYNMINNNKYGAIPKVQNIINEESDEFININNKLSRKEEVENFINREIINENREGKSLIETSQTAEESEKYLAPMNTSQQTDLLNNQSRFDNESLKSDASSVVTRSSMKSKELDKILDGAKSDESNESGQVELDQANLSETSKSSKVSKSSTQIINSPPVIRKKAIDRLEELNDKSNKKNIKVISKKKSNLSNKFEKIDSYFDSIMK